MFKKNLSLFIFCLVLIGVTDFFRGATAEDAPILHDSDVDFFDLDESQDLSTESNFDIEETSAIIESYPEAIKLTQNLPTEIQALSEPNKWHFLIQPSLYVPLTIYGDATVGRLNGDFAIGAAQIRKSIKDDLNLAFFGRAQAWRPDYRLGVFTEFDYLSLTSERSITRPILFPNTPGPIPVTLNAAVDSKIWSFSLGGAYRFYDRTKINSTEVKTEYDLGPLVFDIFGGLNVTGIDLDFNLNTNIGQRAGLDASKTITSPILGGRFRYNFSPQIAWVTSGSVSGFGIEGLTQWNLNTGVDWLFSDKTSLGAGYRFGYTGYNSNLRNNADFGLNVNQNGPYVNLSFRF
ncbi:outer membrane protein [Picosynechococcus sp. NKBG15041c]|uniref:outer membrane protein n=1 Tax=Picosynechococcus sp. NKBG15041c TaxID=1407650 RepID=UPI00040354C9|nr:hypothetical protein [Picosynechococcus sp. NKBG15041c]